MNSRKLLSLFRARETDAEKATFRNMMLITYCITLVAAAAILLIQFDTKHFTTWEELKKLKFPFGCAGEIPWDLYIVATICQSLVPTTLTFAGSILMLQSFSEYKYTGIKSSLFVAIVTLAIFGVVQNSAKTQFFLAVSSFGSVFLSVLTLYLSKSTFTLEVESSSSNRKRNAEITDCQPCA